MPRSLAERFHRARSDARRTVLEGFHPLKHAMRFGASLSEVVTRDREALAGLAAELAPDLAGRITQVAAPVSAEVFDTLAPTTPATGVIAIAERPERSALDVLGAPAGTPGGPADTPVVLLEDPVHLGNVGAVVRVAAAAGAAGVVCAGRHDPWSPEAVRGAAGLQFALPVARVDGVAQALQLAARAGRPMVALDPGGEPLRPGALPRTAVLAFGTERAGLSEEIGSRADRVVSIPMRAGVSSLNLATAVAVALYGWRLSVEDGGERTR